MPARLAAGLVPHPCRRPPRFPLAGVTDATRCLLLFVALFVSLSRASTRAQCAFRVDTRALSVLMCGAECLVARVPHSALRMFCVCVACVLLWMQSSARALSLWLPRVAVRERRTGPAAEGLGIGSDSCRVLKLPGDWCAARRCRGMVRWRVRGREWFGVEVGSDTHDDNVFVKLDTSMPRHVLMSKHTIAVV